MADAKMDKILEQLVMLNAKIDKSEDRILNKMQDVIGQLNEQIKIVKDENNTLKETVIEQEKRIERLEEKNRRNNIVVHGIEEDGENPNELEIKIKNVLEKSMELSVFDSDINYVHRIGAKSGASRPVLVACTTWRLKRDILINNWRLKNTPISIKEDFSKAVRDERRDLGVIMGKLRLEGMKVSLRYNKLLADGKLYSLEEAQRLIMDGTDRTEIADSSKRQRSEENEIDLEDNQHRKRNNVEGISKNGDKTHPFFQRAMHRKLSQ